jgi:hypothetical protein
MVGCIYALNIKHLLHLSTNLPYLLIIPVSHVSARAHSPKLLDCLLSVTRFLCLHLCFYFLEPRVELGKIKRKSK